MKALNIKAREIIKKVYGCPMLIFDEHPILDLLLLGLMDKDGEIVLPGARWEEIETLQQMLTREPSESLITALNSTMWQTDNEMPTEPETEQTIREWAQELAQMILSNVPLNEMPIENPYGD